MLGIGGAAPVAHQQKLMPPLKGPGDQTGAVNQPLSLGFKETRLQAVKGFQMLLNSRMHWYKNKLSGRYPPQPTGGKLFLRWMDC